ncbi:MAG: creatininase family protein [Chloroflexi bacterium]|nr:creatininase family protein [Chloroflexota bacterium]
MTREVIYSVRGPKNMCEMTYEEVAEELKHTDLVIFEVSSIEEHGPHMPLCADTIQGAEVSRRMVLKLGEEGIRAVAGPTIPFGICLQLMDFPGSITVSPATLEALLKDVCNSLIRQGFRKLVLLVSHVQNLGVAYNVVQEISQQPDVRIMALNWIPLFRKHRSEIVKSKQIDGHAGEGETARVLAACPELVMLERAQAYHPEAQERLEFDEPFHAGGGVFDPPREMREETPVGNVGDPSLATAETGEKCYDLIVGWCCEVVKRHFKLQGL